VAVNNVVELLEKIEKIAKIEKIETAEAEPTQLVGRPTAEDCKNFKFLQYYTTIFYTLAMAGTLEVPAQVAFLFHNNPFCRSKKLQTR
jgi:hypothetical protein